MPNISHALFQSLIEGTPLITDLPEAGTFPSRSLVLPPHEVTPLNLRQKLGYLYEDTLAVMLEATPAYEVLSRGLQLRQVAGHTLGELDFLIRDLSSKNLIHLELAVKFYLSVETESDFLLPGPDARDNYYRKLDKLRSHQLALVETHRDLLPEDFREEKISVQQLVHGCVFDHIGASKPAKAEFLNPNGRRGKWLHVDDCNKYFGKKPRLEVIPKPLWPVPLEILAGMELEQWKIDPAMDRCVMVRNKPENSPYFIAPNGYPA